MTDSTGPRELKRHPSNIHHRSVLNSTDLYRRYVTAAVKAQTPLGVEARKLWMRVVWYQTILSSD